jgi:DNA repair photolyase
MDLISAKTIITKNKNPDFWFGHDYNMNIYKGCCHGCIYCDSRSECYHVDNFDMVRAKENALEIIGRELKSKTKTGVIGTGAMSDPYNPFEKNMMLTRRALKIINEYGFGAAAATKSDLIVRDTDILSDIQGHSPVCIKLTITAYDDALCKKIEPNAPPASARFKAVEKLSQKGIFTGILLMPVLPFINDTEENIQNITAAAAASGAKFIYPLFGVTLRQNQRDYFYLQLDRYFSGIRQKYMASFGYSYMCMSRNNKKLWDLFVQDCEKYGLLYKMEDIISAYKTNYGGGQLKFF